MITVAWFTLKIIIGWLTRYHEKHEYVLILSLLSYIICTNVTSIVFLFHYTFFVAVLFNRFCNFVENFERNVDSKDDDDLIKSLDDFVFYYSTFESLIKRINSIFCLQVIDQVIVSMTFYFRGFSFNPDNFHTFCDSVVERDSYLCIGFSRLESREHVGSNYN